jgi:GT2 family glycosyltransferase
MTRATTTSVIVGICTLNRLESLKPTISEALAQLADLGFGRLVVVDNGSTDGTPEFLEELAELDDRVTFLVQPRRGLYFGRVALIDRVFEESARLLIALDDDAVPQAKCFERLIKTLDANPDVGVVGCAIDPLWEVERPPWLTRRFLDELAIFPDVPKGDCRFPRYPPGVCLGLRVNACLRLYRDADRRATYPLGRDTTSYKANYQLLGGEDTDLCEIYVRNGFRVICSAKARVFHRVTPDRVTFDWMLRKFEGEGRTRIRLLRLTGSSLLAWSSIKIFAALPLFLALKLVLRLTGASNLLAAAYYRKSMGAWKELLFGPKIKRARYAITQQAAGNGRTG